MTICLSVSAGGICHPKNDIISLLFLFLGEEKCEKEIKNDIYGKFVGGCCRRPSSTARGALSLYVGGVYLPTEVFSAAGKETR